MGLESMEVEILSSKSSTMDIEAITKRMKMRKMRRCYALI